MRRCPHCRKSLEGKHFTERRWHIGRCYNKMIDEQLIGQRLKESIEKPRVVEFWGKDHTIVPLLVDQVLGDGKRLIMIEPVMFRPNYFVVRGDSAWGMSNWGMHRSKGIVAPCDWLEEVSEAITEQFGRPHDCGDEGCPAACTIWEEEGWPVVDLEEGCAWGEMDWPSLAAPVPCGDKNTVIEDQPDTIQNEEKEGEGVEG